MSLLQSLERRDSVMIINAIEICNANDGQDTKQFDLKYSMSNISWIFNN